MGGVTTYLLSKEIYVLDHEFYTGCSILMMAIFAINKFGPTVGKYLEDLQDKYEKSLIDSRQNQIEAYEELIEHEKKEQWRSEAQQLIMDAKKENILMQLEAAYRERLAHVGAEVGLPYRIQPLFICGAPPTYHNLQKSTRWPEKSDWINTRFYMFCLRWKNDWTTNCKFTR